MLWLAWLALGGCGSSAVTDTGQAFYAPDEAGPFAIGTMEAFFVSSADLTASVQVWYPAVESGVVQHRYDRIFDAEGTQDALAACDSPRPVVVFSHGNTGVRYQSWFLTDHLATHGYVVVAPSHVGNTIFDYDVSRLSEVVFRRPADVTDTFDWLLTQAEPGGWLEGCIDASAGYALAGHSFGGYTTLATSGADVVIAAAEAYCAEFDEWLCSAVEEYASAHPEETRVTFLDERVWAGVPMAPAGFEALTGGLADAIVPTFFLAGSLDTSSPMANQIMPMFDGLGSQDKVLAEIHTAGHLAFSNACDMLPTYDECAEPFIDVSEGHQLIKTAVAAFLGDQRGIDGMVSFLPTEDDRVTWLSE